MFKSDIEIKGKHAAYIKQLVQDTNLFTRNIDVFMSAPLLGYIYGRREDNDRSEQYSEVIRKIDTQQLLRAEKQLDLIYRLIMLLDNTSNLSVEDQVDRAFRHDSKKDKEQHKKNMELFYSYVLGGITILHEKIIQSATVKEDYYKNINDFINEFNLEVIGISEERAEEELKSVL